MAAPLKAEYPSVSEDFDSSAKIVKFVALKKPKEEGAAQEQELASFEALMLPHLDAAQNLAKWLLRNEQDAQDVVQEAYLRALKSFSGFHGSNGRAWLLTIVRNTSYTLMKKNLAAEFREILVLRHLEGLSYKEIADIAQIPPGTVMSRLARARAKLKECLAARIGKEK